MITIKAITNRVAFDRLQREWDDVFAASGSSEIKATHAWLSAWARTRGRGSRIFVLTVRNRHETIAFVPLMFRPGGKRSFLSNRALTFMGEPWYVGRDFVIARDREIVVPAVLRYLSRRVRCSQLHLSGILGSSPNLEAFRFYTAERGAPCAWTEEARVLRIKIHGRSWGEYLRTTSKSFVRKDIARLQNRYAERDWRIQACHGEQLPALLPTMARLHHASQMRQGRGSKYHDGVYREFLGEAARHPSLRRSMRIFLLEVDGRAAAYELGYLYGQTFHSSNAGFDSRFAKLSPSKFLQYHILENGFQAGWEAYCLGAGEQDYKGYWGAEPIPYHALTMSNGWGIDTVMRRWRKRLLASAAAPELRDLGGRAEGGVDHAPFLEPRGWEPGVEESLSPSPMGAPRSETEIATMSLNTDSGRMDDTLVQ